MKISEFINIKTIRGKFFILAALLTIIPMFILSIVFYNIAADKLSNNAKEHALSSLRMGKHYMDQMAVDLYDLLNVILSNQQLQDILEIAPNDDYDYIRNGAKYSKSCLPLPRPNLISLLLLFIAI